ncbi:hypothetical protein EJ05DRAFT_510044 [Pseudovirgaria hyperparasitica]|uniref:Uncharacterized protein n=1 Tax=Pseudovirgaria hyperparasitica TaxID=470096 RepID=A0A6A6W8J3_9PEZI|nr:uncharacterized protein EJ05DRAFT_510044 [Pseudovirgaria hyperparasitica]KAF2759198.1 hypothetical protein EJ05DRAFT_510044 [Pseudovirgaria hyperparasitica]
MSDYGDYSDDDFFEFDLDYTYVEDGYHIADDLAERAVASPPPFADDDDYYDWDRFDYYEDIEDGSAGYYDYDAGRGAGATNETTVQRRERPGAVARGRKKRKLSASKGPEPPSSPTPTVAWRTQKERTYRSSKPMNVDAQQPVALLKDWRTRFANSSLEEFKKKPKAQDEGAETFDIPPEDGASRAPMIDEDAFKAALVSRLGSAGNGLQGLDPNMLLQYAMRMLGGEEDADDVARALADDLFERDEDDPAAEGISNFLSHHGATEEGKDETMTPAGSSVDEQPVTKHQTPQTTKPTRQTQHPPTPSSSDTSKSASRTIDTKSPVLTAAETKKRHNAKSPSPAPQPSSRKRKADSPETATENPAAPRAKRVTRSFDAPTASSKARTSSRNVSNSTSHRGRKR